MNPFPPSWPVEVNAHHGTVPDSERLKNTALGAALPDPSWVPLVAAAAAVGAFDTPTRKALSAALARHAPHVTGFEKALKPPKAWSAAVEAGLDLDVFAQALLLLAPGASMATVLKQHKPEVAFAARAGHHHVEHRLTSKAVPAGLGVLSSLQRLTLLSPGKLKSSDHLAALSTLPRPVVLTLAFDGVPDVMGPEGNWFLPPKLELLAPGGFKGLSFETTGAWVRLSMEDLSGLSRWERLETLVLTSTEQASLSLDGLKQLQTFVPKLKQLVLPAELADAASVWPGLKLAVHNEWCRLPEPWSV